jgi:hypothetical protein
MWARCFEGVQKCAGSGSVGAMALNRCVSMLFWIPRSVSVHVGYRCNGVYFYCFGAFLLLKIINVPDTCRQHTYYIQRATKPLQTLDLLTRSSWVSESSNQARTHAMQPMSSMVQRPSSR